MSFNLKLWLTVFFYALFAGVAIQLVLLPHTFPSLHGGAGLMAGHDWNGFHQQAIDQASNIRKFGWQVFRLRPDGENIIAGFCSVLYYFFTPEPWTLLPINAAFFASAALALFLLVKLLDVSDKVAVFAVMPFVFFPSSAVQFSQIHKDVFCTSGLLVILWCWVSLFRSDLELRKIIGIVAMGVLATGVVWLFRPYFMQILLYSSGVFGVAYLLAGIASIVKTRGSLRGSNSVVTFAMSLRPAVFMFVLSAVTYQYSLYYLDLRFAPTLVSSNGVDKRLGDENINNHGLMRPSVMLIPRSRMQSAEAAQMSEAGATSLSDFLADAAKYKRPVAVMKPDAPVENFINKAALKLAVARGGFTNSGKNASTNIDREIVFYAPVDVLRYIPRALQIGFFAPFPAMWSVAENQKSDRVEIYISILEMLVCYVALMGWIHWMLKIRKASAPLWVPAVFAGSVILLMGLTVANVGTLYRMRFPFLMCFVSFGIAGLLQFFDRSRKLTLRR